MNITGPYWWLVGNGSSICLVPSGNKSLPEPMLTQTYITIWCNKATMSFRITQWREIRTLRVKCNSTITPLTSHTCHGVLISGSSECLIAYSGKINKEKLKAALFTLCEGKPAVTCGFNSQKTSNAASCSILWRHRAYSQIYHYRDVIIGAMASQISQPHDCLLNRSFWRRSKKTSKFCVTGLCGGNSPFTGELPAQMASNAKKVPIWWRHHAQMRFNQNTLHICQWRELLMVTQNRTISPKAATLYLANTKQCYTCKER